MQTFMPYPEFLQSVRVLDNKRLGKQRVEAQQILNILEGKSKSKAWRNHPAVKMWKGYEKALKIYINACIIEWKRRGFRNSMPLHEMKKTESENRELPFWIGDNSFHASHRSNLLRKLPSHYQQFGWREPNNLPYKWPV